MAFGLIAGVVFQGVNRVSNLIFGSSAASDVERTTEKVETTKLNTGSGTTSETDVEAVAEACMPSIVSITNMSVQEVRNFFGGAYEQEVQSAGSGIIIGQNDKEMLIVTNNHVISSAQQLTVTFCNETSVEAYIKGADSTKDVAVIAVKLSDMDEDTLGAIKVATIGDSDKLKVGQSAIAIGNALGYGQSVTAGIISALDRSLGESTLEGLIQTDAAINPGNSGGALLNSAGELIGINVAKVSSSGYATSASVEAMGYAIPISDVEDLISDMMNRETKEKVNEDERGILGVSVSDISAEQSQATGMPEGVYVQKIIEGSGADKAGMEAGDIITSVDGMGISGYEDLKEQLSYFKAGEKVKVTVQRLKKNGDYESVDLEVTLMKSED
ncbi:MAG: trypsin-like peptidase domain-containing protein [Clostridiales bacterium]|nr:trypsin-like peptidase domain-containing protein [Clostridiales bacterium]